MTTEASKFYFTNEVTEFAETLGNLTPDKYSHDLEVGDTVELSINLLGIPIESGVVAKILNIDLSNRPDISEALDYGSYLDDDQLEYLSGIFDYVESDLSTSAMSCEVKFSQIVSEDFVKVQLANFDGQQNGIVTLRSGRIKAKLSKRKNGTNLLTGRIKCFLTGMSVVSTEAIDNFKKMHATQSTVENVAWSDRILPPSLLAKFNEELDKFCRSEAADYHPGSGAVVRDIVHPSLYCFVKGITELKEPLDKEFEASLANREHGEDVWGRRYEDSKFQWLPSEFHVSEKGKVKINSYINNLDRGKYPEIYSGLERMFEKILPMFEAVCDSLRNDFYGLSSERLPTRLPLRNRTLQVIPKIVEYRVNQEENFDGVWHVEGMSHENILATAVCVVKRDRNFAGAEIEFRRFLFEEEGNALMYNTPQNAHRPTDMMAGGDVRPLGRMKTPARRVMVFPNSHIHRLSSMYSSDGHDALRRIVVFWLVNPERPIISTANIAPQQNVTSLEDAKRYRLSLMAERKLHKEDYSDREVSLCEH